MPDKETTTKLNVDISELKKEVQEAKQAIDLTNSEFKAAVSSMDNWAKSSDGVATKLQQLNSNLKSQEDILSSLEAQYNEVVNAQGEATKGAKKLLIQINQQKTDINYTKKEIDKFEESLEDVSSAEKIAAKTGKEVSEVLEDMKKEAENANDGFTVLKGAVATFAGNIMTKLAGKFKDGVLNLMNLSKQTREYRTELGKLDAAATQAGASTDYIKGKWHDMSAVLGDEGAVSEGLNNLMAAGYNTKEQIDAITSHLEGAAIKWKDTLKFEGLADGLQETLATGAAVGPFAEMLERSGVSLETFDEGLKKCTSTADKQNYVLQQLSELGLSELSEAYRQQNKDIIVANKANSEYTDKIAKFGKKVEPIVTAVKDGFGKLVDKASELVGDVDIDGFADRIASGFKTLSEEALPKVVEGLEWSVKNIPTFVTVVGGLTTAFLANKAAVLMNKSATEGLTLAQYALKIAQEGLNTAFKNNAVGIIITAITALVAVFVHLWNNCEGFRNFWIGLWKGMKDAAGKGMDWIGDKFNFFVNLFKKCFNYLYENSATFRAFIDFVVNAFKKIPEVGEWVVDGLKALPGKMFSIGKDVIKGIWNGINNAGDWLKNKIKSFGGNIVGWFKKFFKIKSPSQLMRDEVGVWIAKGIAVGIDEGSKYATDSLSKLSEKLLKSEQHYLDESARLEREKEEAEYQEKLAAAKTAEEIEKVKQERINAEAEKAQKAYLDGLKATADEERSIFDKAAKGIEDFVSGAFDKVKELGNLQKSIADTMFGEGSRTYSTLTFKSGDDEFKSYKLADVGTDNRKLKQYNDMLDELASKRGNLPDEIAGYLADMGINEGMAYVQAMLSATDDEFANYISALEEKSRLAQEIGKKVTTTQTRNLKNELLSSVSQLPAEFLGIGTDSAAGFGESFITGLGKVLEEVKALLTQSLDDLMSTNISSLTKDIVSNVRDKVATVKATVNGTSATLNGVKSGSVVNQFTQHIYSPTALRRVDIYRNTKNLLGLSGGIS